MTVFKQAVERALMSNRIHDYNKEGRYQGYGVPKEREEEQKRRGRYKILQG